MRLRLSTSHNHRPLLRLAVIGLVIALSAFVYLPTVSLDRYESDDYLFLSQVKEFGLLESLIVPWNDHFLPLYRLFMGGLYYLFETSTLIRLGILLFHLANCWLIFHIVHTHTSSIALSAIAALAYGSSLQPSSCILWCINGHWTMSLTFFLLMSICFDAFAKTLDEDTPEHSPTWNASQGSQVSAALRPANHGATVSAAPKTSLKFYYRGLLCFLVSLGFFSIAAFAGIGVWLYLYARLLWKRKLGGSVSLHLRIILPFVGIVTGYLLLREYLNSKYFLYQTSWAMRYVESTFADNVRAVTSMSPDFYLAAIQRMLPFPARHYVLVLCVFSLLLLKGIIFKMRETYIAAFWLMLGFMMFAIPLVWRIHINLLLAPWIDSILHWRFFCYPVAATSIAFGLLLSPPLFLSRNGARRFPFSRILPWAVLGAAVLTLNVGNARTISSMAAYRKQEHLKLYQRTLQYRTSMTRFLNSPTYSPEQVYHFQDGPAAPFPEFSAGLFVRKKHLFKLYFPRITNVHFDGDRETGHTLYLWTPQAVQKAEPPDIRSQDSRKSGDQG
jgi:hypothetical protein